MINAAIYQTSDIDKIKAAEKAYFLAQTVNISPLKLALGAMFSTEVTLSDQPGTPVTATFETIAAYLKKYDEGAEVLLLTPEQQTLPPAPDSGYKHESSRNHTAL